MNFIENMKNNDHMMLLCSDNDSFSFRDIYLQIEKMRCFIHEHQITKDSMVAIGYQSDQKNLTTAMACICEKIPILLKNGTSKEQIDFIRKNSEYFLYDSNGIDKIETNKLKNCPSKTIAQIAFPYYDFDSLSYALAYDNFDLWEAQIKNLIDLLNEYKIQRIILDIDLPLIDMLFYFILASKTNITLDIRPLESCKPDTTTAVIALRDLPEIVWPTFFISHGLHTKLPGSNEHKDNILYCYFKRILQFNKIEVLCDRNDIYANMEIMQKEYFDIEHLEFLIEKHPAVDQAAVKVTGCSECWQLSLFYISTGIELSAEEINNYLSGYRIPRQLIPSRCLKVTEIPIDSNGNKVRANFVDTVQGNHPKSEIQYETDEIAQKVISILRKNGADTFSLEQIHQSFYELGVNSLVFIEIAVLLEEELDFVFDDYMLDVELFKDVAALIDYIHTLKNTDI